MSGSSYFLEKGVHTLFSTPSTSHHFFGYYDVSPLDATGRYLLAISADFSMRMPTAEDVVELCLFDLKTGERRVLGTTRAFNWQQGCRLQWLGPDFCEWVIYNDREASSFVAVVLNVKTGEKRVLPHPVYSVDQTGNYAVCVNHERHYWCRPGYNYQGIENFQWRGPMPEGDGITLMDLKDGNSRLIIKTADVAALKPLSSMKGGNHILEHLLLNPSGRRFVFFHRWETEDGGIFTRVYTANIDGTDIYCLGDEGSFSHNCWQDDAHLLMWCGHVPALKKLRRYRWATRCLLKPLIPIYRKLFSEGSAVRSQMNRGHYKLFQDRTDASEAIGEGVLLEDGHPTFSPVSKDIFLSDTYHDRENFRHLFAYDLRGCRYLPIGRFFSPAESNSTGFRCDLHPRWGRAGRVVCVDSLDSGVRRMHVLDVSSLLEREGVPCD